MNRSLAIFSGLVGCLVVLMFGGCAGSYGYGHVRVRGATRYEYAGRVVIVQNLIEGVIISDILIGENWYDLNIGSRDDPYFIPIVLHTTQSSPPLPICGQYEWGGPIVAKANVNDANTGRCIGVVIEHLSPIDWGMRYNRRPPHVWVITHFTRTVSPEKAGR